MSLIISDSTTIITLLNIKRVDVLRNLFSEVFIPCKVYDEMTVDEEIVLDGNFFIKKEIEDKNLCRLLMKSLDDGESEAIVLAKEMNLSLIIDEKKGRKVAKNLGINIFGFIGLLLLNYRKAHFSAEECKSIFYQAKQAGFRVGEKLEDDFLALLSS